MAAAAEVVSPTGDGLFSSGGADLGPPKAKRLGVTLEWVKIKSQLAKHSRVSKRHSEKQKQETTQWRQLLQKKLDLLYEKMLTMEANNLVDPDYENAEEAILGVICLTGDWFLAEVWLSRAHSKRVCIDFQLFNFCDTIEAWLRDLKNERSAEHQFLEYATSCQGLASCLLKRVSGEVLEGCTIMHLAALSGDLTMVTTVTHLWDCVTNELLTSSRRTTGGKDDDSYRRIEEQGGGDWQMGTYNSLGFLPYDLVPSCEPSSGLGCLCSASFNDIPCTAFTAQKLLLAAHKEVPSPVLFSGFFAAFFVSVIMSGIALHLGGKEFNRQLGGKEWVAVAVLLSVLWILFGYAAFVRHLWNMLRFSLIMLDLQRPPSQRPPPSPADVATLTQRRLLQRTVRALSTVLSIPHLSDNELLLLDKAVSDGHKCHDIDKDLLDQAQRRLWSHREAARRESELAETNREATKLLAALADMEATLKSQVEEPVSAATQRRLEQILEAKEIFDLDDRVKEETAVARIHRKAGQLNSLLQLRHDLAEALNDLDDDRFEAIVGRCREARIQDSKAVRVRLRAIDQPRTILALLEKAINAKNLDGVTLQRALNASAECNSEPERSGYAHLRATTAKAKDLLAALKALEQAQAQGRKAHAQLLVSPDHDVRHIARLAEQLNTFLKVARRTRDTDEESSPVEVVRALLEKWKREEGPSQILKAAVVGTDTEVLKKAIAQAKEAGIGIKAAKKKLAQLEQLQRNSEELRLAIVADDVARLKQAISAASKSGLEVTKAKEVLAKLTVVDACKEQLRIACESNREDRLEKAIARAKTEGIDTTAAEVHMETLIEKRQMENQQKEKERASRQVALKEELDKSIKSQDTSIASLVETMRLARSSGLEVSDAALILKQRLGKELDEAMDLSGSHDVKALGEALRQASLLDGLVKDPLDLAPGRQRLEEWRREQRVAKELKGVISIVEKNRDERSLAMLLEQLDTARTVLVETSGHLGLVEKAESLAHHTRALLDLQKAQRTCRLAHEQNCMMHPRVDKPKQGTPEHVIEFRARLDEAEGLVGADSITEMRRETTIWEAEANLIYRLRDCIAKRDAAALAEAIDDVAELSANINLDPPRRSLDKLNKQTEQKALLEALNEATQKEFDCAALSAAIDAAKAAGVATYDATVVLVQWKTHGKQLLSRARSSRNRKRLREALEATAEMGLGKMPEWQEAKQALEGRANLAASPHAMPPGEAVGIIGGVEPPRHPRYKTELCTHWLVHGSCTYGKERCNFAHGEADLRKPSYAGRKLKTPPNSAAGASMVPGGGSHHDPGRDRERDRLTDRSRSMSSAGSSPDKDGGVHHGSSSRLHLVGPPPEAPKALKADSVWELRKASSPQLMAQSPVHLPGPLAPPGPPSHASLHSPPSVASAASHPGYAPAPPPPGLRYADSSRSSSNSSDLVAFSAQVPEMPLVDPFGHHPQPHDVQPIGAPQHMGQGGALTNGGAGTAQLAYHWSTDTRAVGNGYASSSGQESLFPGSEDFVDSHHGAADPTFAPLSMPMPMPGPQDVPLSGSQPWTTSGAAPGPGSGLGMAAESDNGWPWQQGAQGSGFLAPRPKFSPNVTPFTPDQQQHGGPADDVAHPASGSAGNWNRDGLPTYDQSQQQQHLYAHLDKWAGAKPPAQQQSYGSFGAPAPKTPTALGGSASTSLEEPSIDAFLAGLFDLDALPEDDAAI